jgi:hypothetical protein
MSCSHTVSGGHILEAYALTESMLAGVFTPIYAV